ncbi:NAD(P)/FAD-dependent oxidoreductase [Spirochaeta isovalerica]|uniref:Glycerol-3-phosphate dehydrogenase n=1 Tax=Spirochaeta isovalerica TaxID=150 RepID=A0A841REY4_9SPIO|nr:NAD(P)/FAD-dependent oxidoreductase [Spirochaeta isovalerica]MBB6481560.1 glycerol-3-phosphate dehydrogenase [Spirochaeta isovalerica]
MSGLFDVTIIGAGVIGSAIARKLSSYDLKIALVEKECDVSFGVSKANSGIIHGGFHHDSTTLKSRLEVKGNLMFDQLKEELHFPFHRCGILVAAFNNDEMRTVEKLYQNGVNNKAIGIELCNHERILNLEPKLNRDVVGGLYAPGGGIIEPYRFVFSLVESAKKNGVELLTDFKVTGRVETDDRYRLESADGRSIESKWVVNAAGLYSDEISRIFEAEDFTITPRKGEEFLLDRNASAFTSKVIFPAPSHVSKGMLVIPTAEGTTMVGPTAQMVDDKQDASTSKANFQAIFSSARRLVPAVSERDIITSFTGLRPTIEGDDFYIEASSIKPRFVQVAGIQSPGLTAAPAIADHVKDILKVEGLSLSEKPGYDPYIEDVPRFRNSSKEELDALIAENPAYGEVICRCENISEAEIVAAVRQGHDTLDGVKFYTRAMMGRCQGGFCTHKIMKIISRETGMSMDELTKRGGGSWLVNKKVGDFALRDRA